MESGTFYFHLFSELEIHVDWFWKEPLPALKDLPIQ